MVRQMIVALLLAMVAALCSAQLGVTNTGMVPGGTGSMGGTGMGATGMGGQMPFNPWYFLMMNRLDWNPWMFMLMNGINSGGQGLGANPLFPWLMYGMF